MVTYSLGGTQTPPTGDEYLDKLTAERDDLTAALHADAIGPYQVNVNGWVRTVHSPAALERLIGQWNQKIEAEYKIIGGRNPRFGQRVRI